jgi:hypothetical protein
MEVCVTLLVTLNALLLAPPCHAGEKKLMASSFVKIQPATFAVTQQWSAAYNVVELSRAMMTKKLS